MYTVDSFIHNEIDQELTFTTLTKTVGVVFNESHLIHKPKLLRKVLEIIAMATMLSLFAKKLNVSVYWGSD